MSETTLLEIIKQYVEKGYHLLPICFPNNNGKCNCGRNHQGKEIGKAPLTKNGWKGATNNIDTIINWLNKWQEPNIAIAIEQSGIAVIDVDSPEAEDEIQQRGIPPNVPCIKTGNGKQYLFSGKNVPKTIKTRLGDSGKIDILTSNYIVAPPSRHANGNTYQWLTPIPHVDELPELPEWAIAFLTSTNNQNLQQETLPEKEPDYEHALKALNRIKRKRKRALQLFLEGIETDDRSGAAYELACIAVENGITEINLLTSLVYHSFMHKAKFETRRDRLEDARRCAERAVTNTKTHENDLPDVDDIVITVGSEPSVANFFDGKRLLTNRLGDYLANKHLFVSIAGSIYTYENGLFVPGENKFYNVVIEFLGDEFSTHRLKEIKTYLERKDIIPPSKINKYAHELINVKNGMLEWKTGKLYPHSPTYLSTIQIPVEYDPDAKCPQVEQFFNSVVLPDHVKLLEEIFGYALIPGNPLQKIFILLGSGANGKSVTLSLLTKVIGEQNTSHVPLQNMNDGFYLYETFGKLINVFADLPRTVVNETSIIKALTGEDTIIANRKYKDPITFKPTFKPYFSCNTLPPIADNASAFFRRLIILKFPYVFDETKADPELIYKLTEKTELSGLLNLMINALRRLMKQQKFSTTAEIENTRLNYMLDNNPVAMFVHDRCLVGENETISKSKLYNAYASWCLYNNLRPASQIKFNKELSELLPTLREVRSWVELENGEKEFQRLWKGITLA